MTEVEKNEIINEISKRTCDYVRNMINNTPKDRRIEDLLKMSIVIQGQNNLIIQKLNGKECEERRLSFKKILRYALNFTIIVMTIYNTMRITL
jgi:hypothetical protein